MVAGPFGAAREPPRRRAVFIVGGLIDHSSAPSHEHLCYARCDHWHKARHPLREGHLDVIERLRELNRPVRRWTAGTGVEIEGTASAFPQGLHEEFLLPVAWSTAAWGR